MTEGGKVEEKFGRNFRVNREMREKKMVYNLILEPKLHQKTSKSKIELRKPYLQIWNRDLKTLNPKNQNRTKKSTPKP